MILWLPKHSDPHSKLDPQSWIKYNTDPMTRLAEDFYNREALKQLNRKFRFMSYLTNSR